MKCKKALAIALPLVGLGAGAPGVYAQSEGGARMIEEVVVSARKKDESLQDVPLAVTPFTAEALERRDIFNVEDLANNTVGLSYAGGSTSGYQGSPTIRGLSQGFLQDRVQNVATYLDGVYLQRQSMANIALIDMERIEVVKGPQNSLYGRNAFAGAINYITQKPTEEFEGYVLTTQGDNQREDYRFAASGPLVDGVLLGRFSWGKTYYDGHTDNDHPYNDAPVPGYNTSGALGGWDDKAYNIALTFYPTEDLKIDVGYYASELQRETQGNYVLNGAREVASQLTTPWSDMNSNPATIASAIPGGQPITGNTMWNGALPFNHPGRGQYVAPFGLDFGVPFGAPDPRGSGVLQDPRGIGFIADSDVITLSFDWQISENFSMNYLYGNVRHEGETGGGADRDPLYGAVINDLFNGFDGDVDQYVQTNSSSARPNVDYKSDSHELRFDWLGNERVSASFGMFYSKVEDEQYELTLFSPICTTPDRLIDQDQSASGGCTEPFVAGAPTPLDQIETQIIWSFFRDYWNAKPTSWTYYEDEIRSIFASADIQLTDALKLRLEARYSEEERSVDRRNDLFGLDPGQAVNVTTFLGSQDFYSAICAPGASTNANGDPCIAKTDEETFREFAPRVGLEWNVTDDNFLYSYIAKGIKSGGFNNTASAEQATYDAEEQWTLEIGSKNTLLDGAFQLNAAVYYVDWTDVQGSVAPLGDNGPNANVATGNTGDVTNLGFEVEAVWNVASFFAIDAGFAYTNPEYEDDTTYDSAELYYYYQCDLAEAQAAGTEDGDGILESGERCGNGDVGGNTLPRVSKEQYILGLNFFNDFSSGWSVNARIDGNYQSEQYVTPLNSAYIKSRTLWNASINLQAPEHWEITLWGKNITDKEYISSAFVLSLFNKFIVTQGAGPSYGATVKYNF